ncbi:MAG: diol dehydratase reactivase ATPase-like domain-containing protein [Verrucomicrobiia bacterium]
MSAVRRAVIDIGTNSVKVLVAEVNGLSVVPLWEESEQTRLGQGFYETRSLNPSAIQQTARAVSGFALRAREQRAASVRVIVTSIGREALNLQDLARAVHEAAGLAIETISWELEAEWAFAGVRTDPTFASEPLLVLDVGGGSTEFVFGQGTRPEFQRSFPIGTVRLHEAIRPADPPTAEDWDRCRTGLEQVLRDEVRPALDPWLTRPLSSQTLLVGTGGTTSILAAMEHKLTSFDRERIERTSLSRERICEYQRLLWHLPLAKRRTLPGLPPNRADVILFGAALYACVMQIFEFDTLRISTRGLRFGALAAASEVQVGR